MKKDEIVKLKKELSLLSCSDNLECFLLYGSIFKKNRSEIKDTDIIIILKDVRKNVDRLFDFIFENFPNPDFHIYSVEEIESGAAFFTREYVMEYLSQALCLYGKNVFKEKYREVSLLEYRTSVLIRSVEHVQMVRKMLYSRKFDLEYKQHYLKKYINRLAKNLILFKGISDYSLLDQLGVEEVLNVLRENGLLKARRLVSGEDEATLKKNYDLFCEIGASLNGCMEELGLNQPGQFQ